MSNEIQLARSIRWLCRAMQVLAILIALVAIWFGVFDEGIGLIIDRYWGYLEDPVREAVTYSPLKQALVNTIAGLSFFSPLLIVFGMWRVFGAFAKGPILSTRAVRTIRFLGWMIIARFVASVLTYPAMIVAFTYDNPEGLRVFSVAVSTFQMQSLLLGVLFLLIGHVLTKAVEVAEENGEFV